MIIKGLDPTILYANINANGGQKIIGEKIAAIM